MCRLPMDKGLFNLSLAFLSFCSHCRKTGSEWNRRNLEFTLVASRSRSSQILRSSAAAARPDEQRRKKKVGIRIQSFFPPFVHES